MKQGKFDLLKWVSSWLLSLVWVLAGWDGVPIPGFNDGVVVAPLFWVAVLWLVLDHVLGIGRGGHHKCSTDSFHLDFWCFGWLLSLTRLSW